MTTFPQDADNAACRQPETDPEWWFVEDTRRAKRICNGYGKHAPCPVRERCLEYALEWREEGVWGGLTDKERAEIARRNGSRYARPSLTGLVAYGLTRVIPHGTAVGVENHRRHYMPLCDACREYDEERKTAS